MRYFATNLSHIDNIFEKLVTFYLFLNGSYMGIGSARRDQNLEEDL